MERDSFEWAKPKIPIEKPREREVPLIPNHPMEPRRPEPAPTPAPKPVEIPRTPVPA